MLVVPEVWLESVLALLIMVMNRCANETPAHKRGRETLTFHCFSSFNSMLSFTIRVWMGTHIRYSNLSHTSPLKCPSSTVAKLEVQIFSRSSELFT
jgi:hypothetical protein